MREKELWAVHALFYEFANYEEVDLGDTEYSEHGVLFNRVEAKKSDHKEAIRLLTKALEDDTVVSELETWHEDYDNETLGTGYRRNTFV